MCCTTRLAELENTILMLNETWHPEHGLVHVVGYQNMMVNLSSGPNAMILHFPALGEMSDVNMLDTSKSKYVLRDMVNSLKPPSRIMSSFGRGPLKLTSSAPQVRVFEHGSYTVMLSPSPAAIPDALHRVPSDRRPELNHELFAFYEAAFPEYWIAVCCFSNREIKQSDPMLWWYRPADPETFHLPALDGHTGEVPVDGPVVVDHWVIYGSDKMDNGTPVSYRDNIAGLESYLPKRVRGKKLAGWMPNGDIAIPAKAARMDNLTELYRLKPVGLRLVS